jgi:conjugal transfer/entry exclusion protein
MAVKQKIKPKEVDKQIKDLHLTIQMYQDLLRDAQKQIYHWKKFWYESQSKENLLQGYKKVIIDLSNKLKREDS